MYLDNLYHGVVPDVTPGNLCVVGDVHNHLQLFLEKVRHFLGKKPDGRVIQLGDFCGSKMDFSRFLQYMLRPEEKNKVQIVRWNHDDGVPLTHDLSLRDFWESKDGEIITIRWAETPAFARLAWRSYYGEELTDEQFADIITIIGKRKVKPRVIISHDGPQSIIDTMWGRNAKVPSRTSRGLDLVKKRIGRLKENPLGTTWIFGHHHENHAEQDGVQFRAIGELETLEI